MVELGISTFGETTALEGTGQTYSHANAFVSWWRRLNWLTRLVWTCTGLGSIIGRTLQCRRQKLSLQLGRSIPRKSV